MPVENQSTEAFVWMRHVKDSMAQDDLHTGKTLVDLTRTEQMMVRAYAKHCMEIYALPMSQFEEMCERMAGNKQSLLAVIAYDKSSKMSLDDFGLGSMRR